VLDAYLAFDRFLMRWTMRAAMALLVLCCFVSLYQVATRFLFEQPSTWSEVVARSLDIWMVISASRWPSDGRPHVLGVPGRAPARAAPAWCCWRSSHSSVSSSSAIMVWFGFAMVSRASSRCWPGSKTRSRGQRLHRRRLRRRPVGASLAIVGLLARFIEDMRPRCRDGGAATVRREIFEV
jgi:hypothetical protein